MLRSFVIALCAVLPALAQTVYLTSTITASPPACPTPCIVGHNKPCKPVGTCTPVEVCTRHHPCRGQCIATTPPVLGCTVGPPGPHYTPCPTGSTCTPTMISTPGQPWGGECIATLTPPPPPVPCTMGGSNTCPTASTCTPTMISTPGQPWGGECVPTLAATPP